MAARLALAVAVFGLALVFVGAGNEGAEELESGLYGTLAASFLSALLFAAALPFVQQLRRYAALQLAIDVAIVTSLVLFSGAERSIFSFLYLPIAVYGGMLFDRRGGYGAAVASSLGYGAVLSLAPHGPEPLGSFGAPEVKFALWGVHTGALLLVALLASTLARDLRETGERLDASRQDLEDLQSLHERTIACLTSGLLTLDARGRISSFNPEAERITGWSAGDALGEALERVIPGAGALLLAPGASARVRKRLAFRRRDGRPGHLGVAVSPLRGPAGESGHVVIFQDVTEVVRMEQELVRSERLAGVGQLAADIAHEVRNPLAAISGCIEMLRHAAAAPSGENARLMEIVLREVSRLDGLIGDFLRYARPAPPKLEDVAVRPILEEIAQLARAAREGVRIRVDAPPALRVHADASQLRQVLWNLVRNAQQAVGDDGEVRLEAAREAAPQGAAAAGRNSRAGDAGQVTITVSDNGDGIAPEALERIFDPFFTTKAGGSGLGLATVHRIVESHGGSIEVTSRPGEGAAFRVRLAAGGAAS
jgi:two-component system sensor histidine kinase PilS (NtrC family)